MKTNLYGVQDSLQEIFPQYKEIQIFATQAQTVSLIIYGGATLPLYIAEFEPETTINRMVAIIKHDIITAQLTGEL